MIVKTNEDLVEQNPVIPEYKRCLLYTNVVIIFEIHIICMMFDILDIFVIITGLTWAENRSDMDCE